MARAILVDITKRFGQVVAVSRLNLTVEDGEFFVLLGPSGCGKTTTLRMVAGLEEPTEGKIFFDDVDVTDMPPDRRNVAMVFQTLALYPHMTAFDNVAFCLRNRRVPEAEIARKVRQALAVLEIEHLADRYPAQLSGGERQRVALARASVREPNIFLLDEPLSSLDAKIRASTRAEFKSLHAQLKATFVYVTHDQVEAMSLGTRVAVMNRGSLEQIGSPRDLYDRPVNTFIATFVGSPAMNLVEGEIADEDGRRMLCTAHFRLPLPMSVEEAFKSVPGRRVIFGVRPEHLEPTGEPGADRVEFSVHSVEPLGQRNQVNLQVGDRLWAALVEPGFFPSAGDRVRFRISMQNVHLFDGETRRSIRREAGSRD